MYSEDHTGSQVAGKPHALGMSKFRIVLLSSVSVLLIVGSLFSILFDREYWPFSPYPMFSDVRGEASSVLTLQLYGVTQEEPHDEILISMDSKPYIEPF